MKYKDYDAILGLNKTADAAAIMASYRKLACKYHPDVSRDPQGEARFKEVAEAYHALKDPQSSKRPPAERRLKSGSSFPTTMSRAGRAPPAARCRCA